MDFHCAWFLTVDIFSSEEVNYLLDLAHASFEAKGRFGRSSQGPMDLVVDHFVESFGIEGVSQVVEFGLCCFAEDVACGVVWFHAQASEVDLD